MFGTKENTGSFNALVDSVVQYAKLLLEDARLSAAEKLIRLLAATALCALATILVSAIVIFVSVAAGMALSEVMNPLWAFLIVAGFYLVLLILLIVFRTTLLVNPISRFISRLLLQAPKKEKSHDESASIPE